MTIPSILYFSKFKFFKFKFLTCLTFLLFWKITSCAFCTRNQYQLVEGRTNCSFVEFEPLCHEKAVCYNDTNKLENIIVSYAKLNGSIWFKVWCTMPRNLQGNKFVDCVSKVWNPFSKDQRPVTLYLPNKSSYLSHLYNESIYYPCPGNDSLYALRKSVCDGNMCKGCPGENEYGSGVGFKCSKRGISCVLPQTMLLDQYPDCDSGEDLCFDSNEPMIKLLNKTFRAHADLNESCFRCADKSMIIRSSAICDGVIDCSDLSDECLCPNSRLPLCKQLALSYPRPPDACSFGKFKCEDGDCINRTQVCDGKKNCLNGADERNCGNILPCLDGAPNNETRICSCSTGCQASVKSFCPSCSSSSCTSVVPVHRDPQPCRNNDANTSFTNSTMRPISYCDKNVKCGTFCDGIDECGKDTLEEQNCPGRVYCKNSTTKKVSVLEHAWCDYIIDCPDKSDELECPDDRFYCENQAPLFVAHNKINDGRKDCVDGSDECQGSEQLSNTMLFHSRTNLLENQILFVLLWIMAFFALTGNAVVIFQQIKTLMKMRLRTKDLSSLKANHILVLSLAVADFMMGVYLLAVGIAYEMLKGKYCQEELEWKSSTACKWMGVTVLVSSETSVLTMLLLTSFRLYAVLKPFRTSSRPRMWLVIALSLGAWAMSITVAILPFTNEFRRQIPDTALIRGNPFLGGAKVEIDTVKKYLTESIAFYPDDAKIPVEAILQKIKSANSWNDLKAIFPLIPQQSKNIKIDGHFGFYSIHSVCMADFFPKKDSPYLALALTINIFNFAAFVYILCTYVYIYLISFRNSATRDDKSDAARMQMKIFRLICTDFFTWIPLCILSFIRLYDVEISGNVYVIAAIVLLPINSALNPLLYSNALPTAFEKVCDLVRRIGRKKPNSFDFTTSGTKSTADL